MRLSSQLVLLKPKGPSVADNRRERVLCKAGFQQPLVRGRSSTEKVLTLCSESGTSPVFSCERSPSRLDSNPLPPLPLPPPEGWDILMGKNPLRLIVKRLWHSADSFSDFLECGHEVYFAVRDFDWQDGKLVNLQPTAKRRRCKECGEFELAVKAVSGGGVGQLSGPPGSGERFRPQSIAGRSLSPLKVSGGISTLSIAGAGELTRRILPSGGLEISGAHAGIADAARARQSAPLYLDCRAELRKRRQS